MAGRECWITRASLRSERVGAWKTAGASVTSTWVPVGPELMSQKTMPPTLRAHYTPDRNHIIKFRSRLETSQRLDPPITGSKLHPVVFCKVAGSATSKSTGDINDEYTYTLQCSIATWAERRRSASTSLKGGNVASSRDVPRRRLP